MTPSCSGCVPLEHALIYRIKTVGVLVHFNQISSNSSILHAGHIEFSSTGVDTRMLGVLNLSLSTELGSELKNGF